MFGAPITAFAEEHLDAAAALLAERHRRHRQVEPLLPEKVDFRAEVAALWKKDGASGAFCEDGFVLATRLDDSWGPNAWIELAGHAAHEPETARDLYAVAAARWVEEERTRHYAVVPAVAAQLDVWYRLGFGQQQAIGVRELPDGQPWPEGIREAGPGDVETLVDLAPLISDHVTAAPAFALGPPDWDEDELRRLILADLAAHDATVLMADDEGALYVRPFDDQHASLAGRPESAFLAWIAVVPDARGQGLGVALTQACFAWARAHGYRTIVADWRVTNLLASRFWPKRGFRTTFLRLYRSIP